MYSIFMGYSFIKLWFNLLIGHSVLEGNFMVENLCIIIFREKRWTSRAHTVPRKLEAISYDLRKGRTNPISWIKSPQWHQGTLWGSSWKFFRWQSRVVNLIKKVVLWLISQISNIDNTVIGYISWWSVWLKIRYCGGRSAAHNKDTLTVWCSKQDRV